jgi:lysophospholipase L1-like esterase
MKASCWLALAAMLMACGCGPRLQPLAPGATVLCFGDSLTYGTGAGEGQSYPEVLARLSGRPVVRSGVPGETSAEGLRRLPTVLAEGQPGLVVLCEGGNDILRRIPAAESKENLRGMIRLCKAQGRQVVLLAVPALSLWLEPAGWYAELAREERVPLEAKALPRILGEIKLKSDEIHPNAAGYEALAQAVHGFLGDRGAW